jgi:hypothetical protein
MTKTINAAQEVLKSFPTPNQILTNEDYKASKVMHLLRIIGFRDCSNSWEAIAMTVNDMCNQIQERPFSTYYAPHKKGGFVKCYDFMNKEYQVTFEEFQALNLIMYCSWLRIPFTDDMYKAYIDFKSSDEKIYWILD